MVPRYWSHGLTSLGLLLVIGSLGIGAQQRNPAAAQKAAQKATQKATAEQQKAQLFQAHITLLGELHQIHHLLTTAKHDYDGHRARAVGFVDKAINALHSEISHHHKNFNPKNHTPNLPKTTTPGGKTTKTTPANPSGKPTKETQAVSDAQMQQAIVALHTVYTQLASLPAKGPHHAQVGKELTASVHELQTALKIR